MGAACSRRRLLGLLGVGLAGLATACQSTARPAPTVTMAPARTGAAAGVTLTVANSELVVGPNRFALAVIEDGRSVANAAVKLEFFQLEGQNATKRSEADASYRAIGATGKGLYATRASFDRAGPWGVQAHALRPDRPPLVARANFEVLARGYAPGIGSRAIPSRHPTVRDVPDPSQLCSAVPPCSLHELSPAEALALGWPALIAFATPGYCPTQTCAPVVAEVEKVKARRAGQASFVHVEIYKDPRNQAVAEAVTEWGLRSEPWVFVVDRGGVIADRLESISAAEELEASLAPLI